MKKHWKIIIGGVCGVLAAMAYRTEWDTFTVCSVAAMGLITWYFIPKIKKIVKKR